MKWMSFRILVTWLCAYVMCVTPSLADTELKGHVKQTQRPRLERPTLLSPKIETGLLNGGAVDDAGFKQIPAAVATQDLTGGIDHSNSSPPLKSALFTQPLEIKSGTSGTGLTGGITDDEKGGGKSSGGSTESGGVRRGGKTIVVRLKRILSLTDYETVREALEMADAMIKTPKHPRVIVVLDMEAARLADVNLKFYDVETTDEQGNRAKISLEDLRTCIRNLANDDGTIVVPERWHNILRLHGKMMSQVTVISKDDLARLYTDADSVVDY